MEFKVNDRVVAMKHGNHWIGGGSFRYRKGDKGTVIDIIGAQVTLRMDNGDEYIGVSQHKFELLQEELKVGDEVEIIANKVFTNGDKFIGTQTTIERITNTGTYVLKGVDLEGICSDTPWFKSELRKINKEAKKTMKFKVGDTLEVIDNSGDSMAKLGDRCNVVGFDGDCIIVKTTDGRKYEMYPRRFRLVKEEQSMPKFTVGSKVILTTIGSSAGAMEFKDGTLTPSSAVKYEAGTGTTIAVYEITGEVNGTTIIRRISDGRVFFVRPQFLKEYIVEPKFKRGDFVVYLNEYFRVSSSEILRDRVNYVVTQTLGSFNNGSGVIVGEDELQEAK